ncbi:hypothetical protein GOP47_0022946 [Adiantum capillus-veneris]|uniref:Uncharacterized protein n=1 Tax=Adiantum capillus-veneris TaxID=13818 RepID=A0A9D4Z6H0_ADICA|nr:hypothetical protein GOP47_0022946 [Adiantum capillus-veneris]
MSKPTSTISRNLPEFPYTPAPAARKPLSALLSRSQFVTTVVSPASASASNPPSPTHPSSSSSSFSDLADPPPEPADFFSAQASPIPSSPSQTFPPSPAPAELLSARIESSILHSSRQASRQPSRSRSVKHPPPRAAEISKRPSSSRAARRLQSSKRSSLPSPSFTEASRPALIESGDRGSLTAHHRRRSSWRRLKKMGNRIESHLQGHPVIAQVSMDHQASFIGPHNLSAKSTCTYQAEFPFPRRYMCGGTLQASKQSYHTMFQKHPVIGMIIDCMFRF